MVLVTGIGGEVSNSGLGMQLEGGGREKESRELRDVWCEWACP